MAKEHNRSHIAVLRGHFTLLLLPPLFRSRTPFQVQNQQLLAYFTSPLRKTLLQTWNPFYLHLAKDSFEDQHLLLLFSFSSSTSKKIPLNRPRSPSGSPPRPNRPPLLCHIHRKEPPSSLPGTHEPADISHRGEAGLDIKHQNLMTLPPEVLRPDTHKARRPFNLSAGAQ